MKLSSALARSSQSLQILRRDGSAELMRRTVRLASRSMGVNVDPFPLLSRDIADSATIAEETATIRPAGTPLTIGWICSPPSAGSGGHTTMFRFIEAMEAAGHRCILFLYDRYGNDAQRYEPVVRGWWPNVRAEVRNVRDGLAGTDACFATSWPTAHMLALHGARAGRRFYLVQDYEPWFYAHGAEYALAEDTYRFGFHNIAVGPLISDVLHQNFGQSSDVIEFGCDQDVYSLTNPAPRSDIAFYAKPDTPRRGYGLAVAALERVHALRPASMIHSFGMKASDLSFPAQVSEHLPPAELARLYNTCAAGLVLSFTNMSLLPNELLACGAIPVINDSPITRPYLPNPHVQWSRPSPAALAQALADSVDRSHGGLDFAAVSGSVANARWSEAQDVVVAAVQRECWSPDSAQPSADAHSASSTAWLSGPQQ